MRRHHNRTEIGLVRVDSRELHSAKGKPHTFLGIDRLTKFALVGLLDSPGRTEGDASLRRVIAAFPNPTRCVLASNGIASTNSTSTKWDTTRHSWPRVRRARHRAQV